MPPDEERPNRPSHLVGQRDGGDLVGPTCHQRDDPRRQLHAAPRLLQDGRRANDQQCSQLLVPAFRYPPEALFDAGHPHWQLDVLESARQAVVEPARFAEAAAHPVEFGSASAEEAFGESLLFGLTVERMHLASAALWWRKPSLPVAYPPESVADLDRWILGCVTYLRQEVQRCVIVGVPSYLAT